MGPITVKVKQERSLLGKNSYALVDSEDQSKLKKTFNQFAAPFNWAYKNLRSIDGIDDLGAALGSTLPEVAAPAVTASIIGGLAPFVYAGAVGAVHESVKQVREIYPQAVQNTLIREKQVVDGLVDKHTSAAEHLHRQAHYQRALAHQKIAKLERNASPINALAMTGMSTGMLASTIAGALDTSAMHMASEALNTAAATTGTVASGIFLASQVGMAAYGVSRVKVGKQRDYQLKQDQIALQHLPRNDTSHSSTYYANAARQSVQEVLQRQRYYNQHHSISAGAVLATGQSAMFASNIAMLSGVAAPIVMGVAFSTGVPLTLAGSAQKIIYENRENKMKGAGHSPSVQKQVEANDIDNAMHGVFAKKHLHLRQAFQDEVDQVHQKYMQYQTGLAEMKLFSLRQAALEQKKLPATPEERIQQLIHMIKKGGKYFPHSTTLVSSDLNATEQILYQYDKRAFTGTPSALRANLLEEVQRSIAAHQIQLDPKLYQMALREVVTALGRSASADPDIAHFLRAEPGKQNKQITLEDIALFAQKNAVANDVYHQKLTSMLIKQAKCDLKFLRESAKNELVYLAHSARYMSLDSPIDNKVSS